MFDKKDEFITDIKNDHFTINKKISHIKSDWIKIGKLKKKTSLKFMKNVFDFFCLR